jgi:hypothetical protein
MLRADDIDERVWKAMVDVFGKPAYVSEAVKKQQDSASDGQAWAKDLVEAERRLLGFDERCEKMADAYRKGKMPEGMFQKHLATGEAGHCVKLGSKGSIEMKLLIAAEPQRLSALRAN